MFPRVKVDVVVIVISHLIPLVVLLMTTTSVAATDSTEFASIVVSTNAAPTPTPTTASEEKEEPRPVFSGGFFGIFNSIISLELPTSSPSSYSSSSSSSSNSSLIPTVPTNVSLEGLLTEFPSLSPPCIIGSNETFTEDDGANCTRVANVGVGVDVDVDVDDYYVDDYYMDDYYMDDTMVDSFEGSASYSRIPNSNVWWNIACERSKRYETSIELQAGGAVNFFKPRPSTKRSLFRLPDETAFADCRNTLVEGSNDAVQLLDSSEPMRTWNYTYTNDGTDETVYFVCNRDGRQTNDKSKVVVVAEGRDAKFCGTTVEVRFVASVAPTLSSQPTVVPSKMPSLMPLEGLTSFPTIVQSNLPTQRPSHTPSMLPTLLPSVLLSLFPTIVPSKFPSVTPSLHPSLIRTRDPSVLPSIKPSLKPSLQPSLKPTQQPSISPSHQASIQPTQRPSKRPTRQPSESPSHKPSQRPSKRPSRQPTRPPTHFPSATPSKSPSIAPTVSNPPTVSSQPSHKPTRSLQPSIEPSPQPTNTRLCFLFLPLEVPVKLANVLLDFLPGEGEDNEVDVDIILSILGVLDFGLQSAVDSVTYTACGIGGVVVDDICCDLPT